MFTNHNEAKAPRSQSVCIHCAFCLLAHEFHTVEKKDKVSKKGAVKAGDVKICEAGTLRMYSLRATPTSLEHHTPATLKEAILNPPEPPFVMTVATSGQKHLTFRAGVGMNRDNYPVQFEEVQVWVEREKLVEMVVFIEKHYSKEGFTKAELQSGDYSSARILKFGIQRWKEMEEQLKQWRGSQLFELACFISRKSEEEKTDGGN